MITSIIIALIILSVICASCGLYKSEPVYLYVAIVFMLTSLYFGIRFT